jgi:hypothetical protein
MHINNELIICIGLGCSDDHHRVVLHTEVAITPPNACAASVPVTVDVMTTHLRYACTDMISKRILKIVVSVCRLLREINPLEPYGNM